MKKLVIFFSECEHSGDLEEYEVDLMRSGAKVIESRLNEAREIGTVLVEVNNADVFKKIFSMTQAFEFSSLYQ